MSNDELIEKLARIIAGDSYPLNEDFELAEECLAVCRPIIERETREQCAKIADKYVKNVEPVAGTAFLIARDIKPAPH